MRSVQKTLSFLCLSTLILGFSYVPSYADDVQDVRTRVLDLQNTDSSLPGGVAEQKGKVGTILGTLFDTSTSGEATIKNSFLSSVFGSLTGSRLVRYNSVEGRFEDSIIRETTGGVGVGGGVLTGYIANFTGNVNITGDMNVDGNITTSDPVANNDVATKSYVDSNTISVGNASTTATGVVQLSGDIGGTYNNLQLNPNSVGASELNNASTFTMAGLQVNSGGAYSNIGIGGGTNDKIFFDNSAAKSYGGGFWFRVQNAADTGYIDSLRIADTGNVGIGVNPSEKLSVSGRISVTSDPNSADDVGDRGYNDGRYVNIGEAIDGATITDGTITGAEIATDTIGAGDIATNGVGASEIATGAVGTSEIANGSIQAADLAADSVTGAKINDGTITAADLGANSVGNSELINDPTFTSVQVTGTPNSANDATNKSYVDSLVQDTVQGIVWKEPNANSGSCTSAREGWATYDTGDNAVYVCNGSSWVNIGNTAVIPYATTSTAGRVQLSGDIGGTWNNVQLSPNSVGTAEVENDSLTSADLANGSVASAEIQDGSVRTQEISNNTITADDLAANSVGNSELIDDPTFNSINYSKGGIVDYKNVAQANINGVNVTGVMKITMGKSWSNTMGRTTIKGYNYNGIGAWEVVVSGYNYTGGPSWVNSEAQIKGSAPFDTVRLGHDGTNNIILLGNTSTVWQYPKVVVSDFTAGHSNTSGWGTGWSIGVQTNETGFTNIVTPPIKQYMTAAGNLGIGTTTVPEKLTVAGRISVTTDPNSADDVGDRGYNDARYINIGDAIPGDTITDNTVDSSEIQNNTIEAVDLAPNSVGASELTNTATFTMAGLRVNAGGNYSNIGIGSSTYDQIYADNTAAKSYGGGLWFRVGNAGDSGYTDGLRLAEGGNVGIGVNPTERLSVSGRISVTTDPNSADDVGDRGYNDARYINIGDAIPGDTITNGTIDSTEIEDETITAADLAANSVGNSELIDLPTFTNVISSAPTATNHLTTKSYVDDLVQGIVWKGPSATSAAATHGACDGTKEGWTTYNNADNAIYICNGTAWVNIGNTAVIPYATTSTAGRVQLSGVLGGTWNNVTLTNSSVGTAEVANNSLTANDLATDSVSTLEVLNNSLSSDDIGPSSVGTSELAADSVNSSKVIANSLTAADLAPGSVGASEIVNGAVSTQEIANDTIVEADISDAFVARNSSQLGGVAAANFMRTDTTDYHTNKIIVGNTNNRRAGMYGLYDSARTAHIWSMGTGYQIPQDGSNFGNLYGFGYKHTNNPTGGTMAGGHQAVWAQNGTPNVALGTNIWTSGSVTANGGLIVNGNSMISANGITHSAKYTDDTRYGYYEMRRGDNTRGGYLGFGTANTLNLALEAANELDVTGGNIDLNNNNLRGAGNIDLTATTGNGVRFWNGSDNFKIHFGNAAENHYGPVTGYSIKNNMSNTAGRGWTWGPSGSTPVAAIEATTGNAQFAGNVTAEDPTVGSHLTTKDYVDAHTGVWEIESGNNIAYKGDNADVKVYSYSSSCSGCKGDFELLRARGTQTSPTIVGPTDVLGAVTFNGYDGDEFLRSASINAKVDSSGAALGDDNVPTRLEFQVSNTTIDTASQLDTKMVIKSDGDVGIGDTTPDGTLKLDVEGQVGATEYCNEDGTTCYDVDELVAGNMWESDGGSKIKVFGENKDVRVYSYGSGGNKSDVEVLMARGTSDADKTAVQSGDLLGGYRFRGYDGTNFITTGTMFAQVTGPTSTNNIPTRITFAVSSVDSYGEAGYEKMSILSNGNVGIGTIDPNYMLHVNGSAGKVGGGSWTNSSDIRLKDVTGDYEYGLEEINKLHPIRFNYKEGNERKLATDTKEVGFVAQEVQNVIPDAVEEGEDGFLDFNMHSINVALVNAIKELFSMFKADAEETDREIQELKEKTDKEIQELRFELEELKKALNN